MTLSIQGLQISMGAPIYYDENWHILLESHLLYLRAANDTSSLNIDAHDGYIFQGDLYSLLYAYQQPPEYHFAIMRMNNLFSSAEYRSTMLTLMVPSRQTMETLRQIYQTVSTKTN